jgi:hypothetical protein
VQVLRTETAEGSQEPLEAVAPILAAADLPAFPMVVVEWLDAWFDQDQTDEDEFRTDYLVRTTRCSPRARASGRSPTSPRRSSVGSITCGPAPIGTGRLAADRSFDRRPEGGMAR